MELTKMKAKLLDIIKKYKFVILILLLGLAFMLLPSGHKDSDSNSVTAADNSESETLEIQLKELLSKIDGAGHVDVLLSKGEGEETVYQTNTDTSQTGEDITERRSTVTVTDTARVQAGLIKQVNPPKYLGAIVVCEGADNPVVQLSIKEAVSKVTGLGSDRISVLKMKQ